MIITFFSYYNIYWAIASLAANFTTLCIAKQNLSIGVNVVSEGSPSRLGRVLLISLGITILPKSSTLLTIPVAVPDICLRRRRSLASVDRCHSLRSLLPPPAALPSLPSSFHISFSFSARVQSLPCAKGGGCPQGRRRDCNASRQHCRGGCPHPPGGRCRQRPLQVAI